jgi:hypothetical protein
MRRITLGDNPSVRCDRAKVCCRVANRSRSIKEIEKSLGERRKRLARCKFLLGEIHVALTEEIRLEESAHPKGPNWPRE